MRSPDQRRFQPIHKAPPRDVGRHPGATQPLTTAKSVLRYYGYARLVHFVTEYLIDEDPRQAAARSGLPPEIGPALLRREDILGMVSTARHGRSSRARVYADEVLRRWNMRATGLITDVAEIRRVNCRHCWGVDGEYQFTLVEMRHSRRQHEQEQLRLWPKTPSRRQMFDEKGGDGFDPWREPNAECTECGGTGSAKLYVRSYDELSERGRMMLSSIKQFPDGTIEVKAQDPAVTLRAEEMVGRCLGMLDRRRQVFDPEGLDELPDEHLDSVLTFLERRGYLKLPPPTIDQESAEEVDVAADLEPQQEA